jgi:HEPN domain-containing protein
MIVPKRMPKWGLFIGHADDDLIAFAVLWANAPLSRAPFFHAQQAIEKYLKALVLSIGDPLGENLTPINTPWIKRHDLMALAERCAPEFPYYGDAATIEKLRFFNELNQGLRYPWVARNGGSLSVKKVHWLEELVHHLRNDVPIVLDNYMLAMLVRGYFHQDPSVRFPQSEEVLPLYAPSIAALRATFDDLEGLVRWPLGSLASTEHEPLAGESDGPVAHSGLTGGDRPQD